MSRVLNQPDMLAQAISAFRAELPQLLTTDPDRWVLFRGPDRVMVGNSQWELFDECAQRGWHPEDCLIQPILEDAGPLDPDALRDK